jgi:hypothetical protein
MKQSILKHKSEIDSWVYLPDTDILPQYFKQNDLIELSKACKIYRIQLKPQVLKKLFINTRTAKLLNTRPLDTKYALDDIMSRLRLELAGNYHLIKQAVIEIGFSNKFGSDLISLFTKISDISIISYSMYEVKDLIIALQDLENLQHITLNSEFCYTVSFRDSSYYSFFYQFKSIHISVSSQLVNEKLPFDILDSGFVNLESVKIFNTRMLSRLSSGVSSLLHVEFSQEYQFDMGELKIFILNNPQLKQITISTNNLDIDIFNCIIYLKSLYKLELKYYKFMNNLKTFIENYSIRHFVYDGQGSLDFNSGISGIIKMCKNLEIYQISDMRYYDGIMSNEFPVVDTLLLTRLFYCDMKKLLPKLLNFNQLKFKDGCKFGSIAYQLLKCTDTQWTSKQSYSNETDEFTLIKKIN